MNVEDNNLKLFDAIDENNTIDNSQNVFENNHHKISILQNTFFKADKLSANDNSHLELNKKLSHPAQV